MSWHTAPGGLYTFDTKTGRAVPILLVNRDGFGLVPGGATTKQIYMLGAPEGDHAAADRVKANANRDGYLTLVRQAELHGIPPCPHGEPRGEHYCALCRRTLGLGSAG